MDAWNTPWKIWNELWRWIAYPRVRLVLAFHGILWQPSWRFYGTPIVQRHRYSHMTFGPGLQLRSSVRSNPLGPSHPVILATWQAESRLEVGSNFAMTGGALAAAESISIGDNVALGADTTVVDTDFHPLDPALRRIQSNAGKTSPVVIEDDVFVGMHCLILKGVRIGRGSVVGAGSVVTCDVPPGVVVAGNPAQVVRDLAPAKTQRMINANARQLLDQTALEAGKEQHARRPAAMGR
jgi:acetyltransferase-like isoleucine patch superfamily enzyme